ncbi:MAG: invasion associated locus B family protein [Aestuariivirga sp.]|uniref:invasion associated locus B family protein n=1 Tax=Aestuariivirga sp. TaxID=2650926 RepID=UPI0025C3EBA6|nr:invasion associated locus B family protein [Aestuariivirga sp.]MCA3559510.1 invasion associated locus B family protein [Aestuariivirga sp.]
MKTAALSLSLLLAASALAPVEAGMAKPLTGDSFGDWVLRCTKTSTGEEACALHQRIIARDTRQPVAAIALARNKDSKELRLAAVLPLGLDIPAGVTGRAGAVMLPFTVQTCVRRGCIASTAVDGKTLGALRGADAFSVTFKMRIVVEPTTIPVSLKGLDAGLKALDAKG